MRPFYSFVVGNQIIRFKGGCCPQCRALVPQNCIGPRLNIPVDHLKSMKWLKNMANELNLTSEPV